MNDPWDVKCVRQAGQYVSCMKLNGVPLLPPVISKECRKEMQYYKLLAKEVEKRITLLHPFVPESDSDAEDKTDAPELPECEYEPSHPEVNTGYKCKNAKKSVDSSLRHAPPSPRHRPLSPRYARNYTTSNVVMESIDSGSSRSSSPKLIIDLGLSINNENETSPLSPPRPQIDLPERDYNCTTKITKKVITEKEVITAEHSHTQRHKKQKSAFGEIAKLNFRLNDNNSIDAFADNLSGSQGGPASLSSKSFTGSLNDLTRDSLKDEHNALRLARQRSYTVLNPSPQLLAHLEVQSLNTGVEMTCISMSESLSNLSPNKKRRSWDLETAKVKWSSMALELQQTKANGLYRKASNKSFVRQQPRTSRQTSPPRRAKSAVTEKTKRSIIAPKSMIKSNPVSNSDPVPKSEPVPRTKKSVSPVRNTSAKGPGSPKAVKKHEPLPQNRVPPPSILGSEDPASRVRELYEKIQNQQLLQMASLVEKQKREQILLQQVFEEQNNVLFKQLKTICPTSPIEVKEAWGDKHLDLEQRQESDRGPVSLSQLINYKSPDQSSLDSPVSNTLANTNNYINHCNDVLKKSRDITGSIKKQPIKACNQNGTKISSPKTQPGATRTRPQSPKSRSPTRNTPTPPPPPHRNTPTSRRLNYDTSASSGRDYEPMLTDRTNDTMADLNVTFPSDNDDVNYYAEPNNDVVTSLTYGKQIKSIHATSTMNCSLADSASRMERTIHNSINNNNSVPCRPKFNLHGTPKEITSACYSLHDTFVASTAAERCAMIAADRGRRRSLAARRLSNASSFKQTDLMSQSHTGAFPARTKRPASASLMTQSNYETFSEDRGSVLRQMTSPHRRPWR